MFADWPKESHVYHLLPAWTHPVNSSKWELWTGKKFQITGELHIEPRGGELGSEWNILPAQGNQLSPGLESQSEQELNSEATALRNGEKIMNSEMDL